MSQNFQLLNELALHCKANSNDCLNHFKKIVDILEKPIYNFIYKRVFHAQDAEDITQETFLLAYRKIEQYDEAYSFSTWVYTIANRQALNHIKKNKIVFSDSIPEQIDEGSIDSDQTDIWDAAKTLPDELYSVLLLKYSDELSIREISQVLSKSESNIKVLLHRARTMLSKKYKKHKIKISQVG